VLSGLQVDDLFFVDVVVSIFDPGLEVSVGGLGVGLHFLFEVFEVAHHLLHGFDFGVNVVFVLASEFELFLSLFKDVQSSDFVDHVVRLENLGVLLSLTF